jgi:hypothetical protein
MTTTSTVPKTQDFKYFYIGAYGTFIEVVCPVCEDSSVFSIEANAKQWARMHKFEHVWSWSAGATKQNRKGATK